MLQLLIIIYLIAAVKCNDAPTVIHLLAALGTGFDCASKVRITLIFSYKFKSLISFYCFYVWLPFWLFPSNSRLRSNRCWASESSPLASSTPTPARPRGSSGTQRMWVWRWWHSTMKWSCTKWKLFIRMLSRFMHFISIKLIKYLYKIQICTNVYWCS